MAQLGSFNSFQVCAMRIARLSASGVPLSGANNGYIAGAPMSVGLSPDFEDGVELTAQNACGQLCGYYKQQSQLKKWDVNFELCELDHELVEILTGVSVIVDGANTVGHQFTRTSACSPISTNGVSLEFWSKRWDNCSPPADGDLYWHWTFGRAYLNVGAMTLENDFLKIPVEGYLEENPNWGNGPWNDFPDGTLDSIGAVYQDTTLPVAVTGWTTVPAQT